jgi:iron(III) transport system substrate-binding protein
LALFGLAAPAFAEEVNVYSARQEELIKPLLDRFTEDTGIKVNLVTGKADALLTRLKSEGRNTPADLLITVDAGRLHRAKEMGLVQPVRTEALEAAVPATYRDPEGHWYGLSLRARPIMYAKDRVDPSALSTYEALASPQWKGEICTRSSSNIYSQSMLASIIASLGETRAEEWARGLAENLARPPQGGDRDQIKAVAAGQCDIAIANTYYLGGMLNSSDASQREAAAEVGVFWPNQGDRGTHVNVSGGGVTVAAKNRDNAIKLLEYLVGPESQAWYASVNYEYPVREGVAWSETLDQWGRFKADTINLERLGELNATAVRVADRAGWR